MGKIEVAKDFSSGGTMLQNERFLKGFRAAFGRCNPSTTPSIT
jgi:hypothetical protein